MEGDIVAKVDERGRSIGVGFCLEIPERNCDLFKGDSGLLGHYLFRSMRAFSSRVGCYHGMTGH